MWLKKWLQNEQPYISRNSGRLAYIVEHTATTGPIVVFEFGDGSSWGVELRPFVPERELANPAMRPK
jgi:hypothetical protein